MEKSIFYSITYDWKNIMKRKAEKVRYKRTKNLEARQIY